MSQYTYIVSMSADSLADIGQITRNDGMNVAWSNADFQAWNAAQPSPFTLSPIQAKLKQLKALSFAKWNDGITVSAADKDRGLYELVQRASLGVI